MNKNQNKKSDPRNAPQPELVPLSTGDLALVSGGATYAVHVKLPPPRAY